MLGSKKKDNLSRMDRKSEDLPQLSNEMQLMIMNKVKNGELTIEDALDQARRDRKSMHKQQSNAEELQEQRPTQHNFSVHKHSRYRWQKRVLQIDFKTKMICSIEKGIIKRQLAFSMVKSCDDGVGSRFSISFKGHHDYELEATSREDKHKITQLVNQIIFGNIYDPAEGDAESSHEPEPSQSLKQGVLLLHRGGLASFRWVKYEVQLHPGQLTLVPFRKRALADGEATSYVPQPIVVHLSDGHTSVQKPPGSDIFTLITHKNEYQFRVPLQDQTTAPGSVQKQRDSWVQAIDKLCSDWKRKSMGEHMFMETKALRNISIAEDIEDSDTDLDVPSVVNTTIVYPTIDYKETNPTPSSGGEGRLSWDNTSEINPSANDTKPVPKSRGISRGSIPDISPDLLIPIAPSTSPVDVFDEFPPASPKPKPTAAIIPSSSPVPKSPGQELGPSQSVVKVPLLSRIPAPPPLPFKPLFKDLKKPRTKAFHWDIVASEKIAKSFWTQESSGRIEIDKVRLYEQFAVKDLGTFSVPEPSDTQQIMLNEKIAHNFNIFLKSFPVQPAELKDKVFIVNEEDGGLSDEHITSLRRYVPTMDDVEMYKSHKGPVAELHIVDQYMMEMCNIPYLSTQLDLLLTLREIPNSINDLQPLINQKIRMCTQLNNCRSFISVLEHLLAIGNYLNDNARKGKARGFRLSSLTKVSELRGRDRKFTLLHALVEQIMLHEPCLASFTQELAEFETVPGASIKGLTAEVDVLKNELQKVLQYKKTSKKRNAGVQHPNFSKDLKTAIEKYNTDLSALTKTCEEMKKLYSVTLVKFGEPADQDSQELFGLICQFVHDFRRVHADII